MAGLESLREPRVYARSERAVDLVIHVAGVLFAVNAALWLLWHVTSLSVVASVSVYCAGLLAMILASATYNLWPAERPAKQWLRRLDHSAIFIMIAATYTPFAANRLGSPAGDIILAAIWVCASIGIALKLLFPHRFETASMALYIAMGWMVVTVIRPLAVSVGAVDFWLLIAGGLVYSAGIAFYLTERIPFHKAIWHGFVLAAAMLHFTAIALEFAA
ncbi:MAG: hemolysin III family protein [Rhizomicrobium sp.]|jgi:hemolysin III